MNIEVGLEVIEFKGTEAEMLQFVNNSPFSEYCRKYREEVMAHCSRGLTPAEVDLFHRYMNGEVASDHPELEADKGSSRRVADSVLEAIHWGLG